MRRFRTIDAHQHFWRYEPSRDLWITAEMAVLMRDFVPTDLIPEMAANGMDACVAVQADQSENETEFLLELAAQHEEIAGVVGWVDLRAANVRERLRHFSRFRKLRGFRHVVQAEPDDRFLLRPDFLRSIACLAEFDFTYDLLVYPRQLPAAVEFVAKFPRQRFVIDHIAKPPIGADSGEAARGSWSTHMRELAHHPLVYCKVSGLVTEANWHNWKPSDFAPFLDVVCEAFGPDRLMFGSDWPVCLLAGSYRRVKDLVAGYLKDRDASAQDKMFGANAACFYGLANGNDGSRAQG